MNGVWSSVEIAGHRVDVFDPPAAPRFAVLHLHPVGGASLRDNPTHTAILAELNLACAVPHGDQSWWADRICSGFDPAMTAERWLLDHVEPWCRQRWRLGPRGLGLHGISMGGQGALRLAFKHPERYPVVAAVSSAIDHHEWYGSGTPLDEMYDSKEQCRQDTAPLHIHPSRQPPHIFFAIDPTDAAWFRGNDRLHEKLSALGVPHTADLETRAGGHSWEYFDRMAGPAMRFVAAGLEQESRRIL
jgi:S-formylglutathione hydrolase